MRVRPGQPYPLGATWDGLGVNFAVFSEQARRVELCLFDSPGASHESQRVVLPEYTDRVWHGYVVDMIDFHIGYWHFPVFNLADAALTLGVLLLLLDEVRRVRRSR